MSNPLTNARNIFFMGIAGTGMSALAQYLQGTGKQVSGSDRYFHAGEPNETRTLLEAAGISCFPQDGSGMGEGVDLVVASTAVEEQVPEMKLALQRNIPVLRRSELLALIAASRRTIAVGGTSGKSTTSALLFDILMDAGWEPGIISGAGLVRLIREGKIGNAMLGRGEWLIIEADESDGSIVQYHPEYGVLLNIDKDHKEIDALLDIFRQFRNNSLHFIVNRGNSLARQLSKGEAFDFSADPAAPAGWTASHYQQTGMESVFTIDGHRFHLPLPGRHNMENALAAVAVARQLGVPWGVCAAAVEKYQGIYRRHQILGRKNGIWVVDDYAHNPAKCAAAIRSCQPVAPKVIAWFQPHGYGPTRFLRDDFIREIAGALRPEDEIWISEIYYAGGTATRDISSADIVSGIKAKGRKAYFVANRADFPSEVRSHLGDHTVILLMGARDPSLEEFARYVWEQIVAK